MCSVIFIKNEVNFHAINAKGMWSIFKEFNVVARILFLLTIIFY